MQGFPAIYRRPAYNEYTFDILHAYLLNENVTVVFPYPQLFLVIKVSVT
jgi:hypothetical protein